MRRIIILIAIMTSGTALIRAQEAPVAVAVENPMPTPSPVVVSGSAAKFSVNVVGKVRAPGRFQLEERSGLLGALAAAGWVAEMADLKHIKIIRKDQTAEVLIVDFTEIKTGKKPDVLLKPEDTVLVEERMVNF